MPASVHADLTAPTANVSGSSELQENSGGEPAYLYNAQGQLQSITYPDGSTYAYLYNAQGDKIRETNRKGRVWSYVYDQNHRPLSVIDPEGRIVRPVQSVSSPRTHIKSLALAFTLC